VSEGAKWQPKVIRGEGQKSSAERAREVAQAVIDHYFGEMAITIEVPKPDLRVVGADDNRFAWSEAWESLAPKP
jgi:hypothetical protein